MILVESIMESIIESWRTVFTVLHGKSGLCSVSVCFSKSTWTALSVFVAQLILSEVEGSC